MTVCRDDLTVQEVELDAGLGNALEVALPTRFNIFLVTLPASPDSGFVKLPPDSASAIGDWIEFHVVSRPFDSSSTGGLDVRHNNGDSFYPDGPEITAAYPTWSITARKVAPNTWRVIGRA